MRLALVDNWNIIGPELEQRGSPSISRWFLTVIIFVSNRIVTNVLVGLMIESVSSVNDAYIKKKREAKTIRNQKKREELSKRMYCIAEVFFKYRLNKTQLGTIQVLNTRISDTHNKVNTTENTSEQIQAKLKLIHNELITPRDFIFSLNWLEKLVACR